MLFVLRAVVFAEPPKLILQAFTGIWNCNGLNDPVIKGVLYLLDQRAAPLSFLFLLPAMPLPDGRRFFTPSKASCFSHLIKHVSAMLN